MRDLVIHTAEVHGRTAAVCESLPAERIAGPELPQEADPFEWAAEQLARMLEGLATADPDAHVWTFVDDPALRFWIRRMVVETGVHRWDAHSAVGEPVELLTIVSAHGLDEFAALYLPRLDGVQTIELSATDLGRSWRYGPGEPTARIEGEASDLFLRLMSRPGVELPPTGRRRSMRWARPRIDRRRSVTPRGPQLLTYPNSLGGSIAHITHLLRGPLAGHFAGVHILPPFPSSGDRGFAPIDYRQIDRRFGSWDDIADLGRDHEVLLDLMVNHISRRSTEFTDFLRRGRASRYADLFITIDKIWPNGDPPPEDIARIFLRKPDDPFTHFTIEETGETETLWTTFGFGGRVEQIDLDLTAEATRELIRGWFEWFAGHGVSIVRLDAVGYVVKQPGTSCFMVEPQVYEILDWLITTAAEYDLAVLPEIHDVPATHRELSRRGYWTYDFVLPGLLLHAFHDA